MNSENASRRIIRRREVKRLCGNPSDATLWRWQRAGKFPRAVQLSEHTIGWYADEIEAWIANRPPQQLSAVKSDAR